VTEQTHEKPVRMVGTCRTAFPKLWGSRNVFEMRFFIYIKIKNHKRWESEKTKQKLEKGKKNKAHNIRRI
jgi:hypothetical protein